MTDISTSFASVLCAKPADKRIIKNIAISLKDVN